MTARRRSRGTGALTVAVLGAMAAQSAASPSEECAARLERTLAEMDARPLLKEELATGLMWIRLDALHALEAGDADECLSLVRVAEQLLGMGGAED